MSGVDQYCWEMFLDGNSIARYYTDTEVAEWPEALEDGNTYQWRCKAHDASGWGLYFDPKWSFTISVPHPPPDPTPMAPPDGDTIWTTNTRLRVNSISGVDQYNFRLYILGNQVDEYFTSYNYWDLTGLQNNTNYEWDCAAHNSSGWGGFFEPWWNFVVKLPSITVTSPNGGEYWKNGEIKDITWTSTGGMVNVKVEKSTDGGSSWTPIWTSIPNDGSQPWGLSGMYSNQCRIRISDASNSAIYDVSNGNFTVADRIHVGSPNGGELWFVGTSRYVNWIPTGLSGAAVTVNYSTNGGAAWTTLVPSTPDDGSEPVTVPDAPTLQARIRVVHATVNGDTSDANFAITRRLHVTSPNGGENWASGDTHNITWTASGLPGTLVNVYKSTNGGATFEGIRANVPDNGTFPWVVSDPPTSQARIMVIHVTHGTNCDSSDANFTISGTGVAEGLAGPVTFTTALQPNAPEPFRTGTALRFSLASECHVTLQVYDTEGRLIWNHAASLKAGRHSVAWDARRPDAGPAPNGIYFCRMIADGFRATRKMVKTD
jgi:hypothetical protein